MQRTNFPDPPLPGGKQNSQITVEAGTGGGAAEARAPTLTLKAMRVENKYLLKVPLVLKPTACYFMARKPQRIGPQRLRGFRHFALYFWFNYLKTISWGLVSHRPPRGAF